MRRVCVVLLILPAFLFLPCLTQAADHSLVKEIQGLLEQSRVLVEKARQKVHEDSPVTTELNELKNLSEEIRATHLLIEEQFREREGEISARGAMALERHQVMSEGYSKALRDYLSLIESLPSEERITLSSLDSLKTLLDQILRKKKRPIFGSPFYRHHASTPNYSCLAPILMCWVTRSQILPKEKGFGF